MTLQRKKIKVHNSIQDICTSRWIYYSCPFLSRIGCTPFSIKHNKTVTKKKPSKIMYQKLFAHCAYFILWETFLQGKGRYPNFSHETLLPAVFSFHVTNHLLTRCALICLWLTDKHSSFSQVLLVSVRTWLEIHVNSFPLLSHNSGKYLCFQGGWNTGTYRSGASECEIKIPPYPPSYTYHFGGIVRFLMSFRRKQKLHLLCKLNCKFNCGGAIGIS